MTFDITMQGVFIGPLMVRFYSLLILTGIGAGIFIAQREARRYGENPEHVVNLAMIGALFAIIGARVYHVFDRNEWPYYSANPGEIIKIWNGGIGIFGALAGAILAVVLYVWLQNRSRRGRGQVAKMGLLRWLDIGAPAFLIGQAVGRWGNFFNQELFGPPTDLPWGIPIDEAYRPFLHLSETHFHPLFLYESILSALGVLALLYVGRRFVKRVIQGDIFLLYFIWYGAERFGLEFLRTGNWKVGAIPTAQIVGIVFIVASVALLVSRHLRSHSTESAAPENTARKVSHSTERRRRRRLGAKNDA